MCVCKEHRSEGLTGLWLAAWARARGGRLLFKRTEAHTKGRGRGGKRGRVRAVTVFSGYGGTCVCDGRWPSRTFELDELSDSAASESLSFVCSLPSADWKPA